MNAGASIIFKYFPHLTDNQKKQFQLLKPLYEDWNAKINVVSRKDIDSLFEKHVLHSLAIAKIIQFKPGTTVLDVGTGGGFPGIPLAIMFPETQFTLVDSIGKKIKVVQEVAKGAELKNVTAQQTRAEQVKQKFDFVVSRAVTEFPEFYNWVRKSVLYQSNNSIKNGILYLKGGDLSVELESFKDKTKIYNIKDHFSEEFFETKKVVYLPIG